MTFSAGVGVCPKAPKAAISAPAKQTAFPPASMRIIIPPGFASVHHGHVPMAASPRSDYYVRLHPFISTRHNAVDAAEAYREPGFASWFAGSDSPRKGSLSVREISGQN